MEKIVIKRTWIMFMMVVIGLSFVWVIPNSGQFKESRLISNLPDSLVDRIGVALEISALERETLANDTTFARMRYFDESSYPDSYIDVSVVFSGKDINNSIHRPEVCLIANGWNFESEKYVVISAGGIDIPCKEIVCFRSREPNENLAHKNELGEIIVDRRVQYYTFIGAEKIVAGHYERTWADIKMRLFKGTDQQWAYITISMDVTERAEEDTERGGRFNILDREQTKVATQEFMVKAMPLLLKE